MTMDSVSVLSSSGCTDEEACNFSSTATEDDGSCSYPSEDFLNCEGDCNFDADNDGICDELGIEDVQIFKLVITVT